MKFCSLVLCCFSVCLLQTTNASVAEGAKKKTSKNSEFELKRQNSPLTSDSSITNFIPVYDDVGDVIVRQLDGQTNSQNSFNSHDSLARSSSPLSSSSPSSPPSSSSSVSNPLPESYPLEWILGERGEKVDYETFGILFSDEPITGLTRRCMLNVPEKHRKMCLTKSYGSYAESRYELKLRCCSKWAQIECLERYTYNSAYCNVLEQITIGRFFNKLRSLDGTPECSQYRPVPEEKKKWSSSLGRIPSCAVPVKAEITNRFPDQRSL